MVYQVKYKCHLELDISGNFVPVITYKYKREDKRRWKKKKERPIDHFAYFEFDKEYYGSRAGGIDSYLYMDVYDRMKIMRRIIDDRYSGSFEEYVKDMVKFDIESNQVLNTMEYEAFNIALSFTTDGWKGTTIALVDKEIKNEKFN